jgi:hypothetical protein
MNSLFGMQQSSILHCFMRNRTYTFNKPGAFSAIFMIVALLWITISNPFILTVTSQLDKHTNNQYSANPMAGNEEETSNPYGNNSEEKSSVNSFSEEYLENHQTDEHLLSISSQYQNNENAAIYIAFHGELLLPPPNMLLF